MDFPPHFKKVVVLASQQDGRAATARRFRIPPSTLQGWEKNYDGTEDSLAKKKSPGRPRTLSDQYLVEEIVPSIVSRNLQHIHTDVKDVICLHSLPFSKRTMNNYTLRAGFTSKRTQAAKRRFTLEQILEQPPNLLDPLSDFRLASMIYSRDRIYVFDEKKFLIK